MRDKSTRLPQSAPPNRGPSGLARRAESGKPVFDPYAYETHEDPYPIYRALRDDAPAYIDAERGFWALSRYDDVRRAIDDWHTFSSTGGITLERDAQAVDPMLIEMDPPRHTELRALVSRAFTPKRVADLAAPTRSLATELLAACGPAFDAIEDFAGVLPMAVISTMLGIPRADQDEVRGWTDAMLHREADSSDITEAGLAGATQLYLYLDRLIATDALECAGLQHAQNLRLRRRCHVADLIQENGAVIALLELADALRARAGERALLMAEQFALQ